MNRLVFDIECIGIDFESLDEISQHTLLNGCKDEEEIKKIKEATALWPVTGEIVAIGMYNVDTDNSKIYFQTEKGEVNEYNKESIIYKTGSEKDILEWFWSDVKHFDQIVTFNGRGFDAPYILFRSMVHNLKPSVNLMPNRYGDYRSGFNFHLDLLDQLTYYNSSRKFSLHLYCQALGITSPKEEGITGLAVPKLFEDGEFETIADYCMRDVYATAKLFKRWQKIAKI